MSKAKLMRLAAVSAGSLFLVGCGGGGGLIPFGIGAFLLSQFLGGGTTV